MQVIFCRAPLELEGNGYTALHPDPEKNLLLVRTFDAVEQLRQALLNFRRICNSTCLIERHAVRQDQILTKALAA